MSNIFRNYGSKECNGVGNHWACRRKHEREGDLWIQDELEKWNGWIANCELVKRVALGIAWVPGYIWKNLGFATARSEMRQTGEDTNISIPSSNFEVPDPNVGWERN
ncbi:uncharacterized protein LOC108195753 isoform X3 [Daucus carota subsp. sativus]|uniref:uncharacterized protein LOC108195753 isoform X3 n=1 Tax=Daucus carota subsp. sativus TaxID=79200 RepID=UPI003083C972